MKLSSKIKSIVPVFMLSLCVFLSACNAKQGPKDVSNQFWDAIQKRDMEAAKLLATWDTVEYLKYLNTDKLHPERYELGEQMIGETRAEVETVLFTSEFGQNGVKLPGVTVLVKTDNGWRVNIKKSMTSVVKYSANSVFDQLNGLMQESIQGLDKTLSEAMNELGGALEQGAEELKRELEKPLYKPEKKFEVMPDNQPSKEAQRI